MRSCLKVKRYRGEIIQIFVLFFIEDGDLKQKDFCFVALQRQAAKKVLFEYKFS